MWQMNSTSTAIIRNCIYQIWWIKSPRLNYFHNQCQLIYGRLEGRLEIFIYILYTTVILILVRKRNCSRNSNHAQRMFSSLKIVIVNTERSIVVRFIILNILMIFISCECWWWYDTSSSFRGLWHVPEGQFHWTIRHISIPCLIECSRFRRSANDIDKMFSEAKITRHRKCNRLLFCPKLAIAYAIITEMCARSNTCLINLFTCSIDLLYIFWMTVSGLGLRFIYWTTHHSLISHNSQILNK